MGKFTDTEIFGYLKLNGYLATDFIPDTADTYDLGSTDYEFANLYLGTGRAYFFDTNEFVYSTGDDLILGGDGSSVVAVGSNRVAFNSPPVPWTADGYALGSATLEWSDLYLADGSIIYFGNDQDVTLTHIADTGLLLNTTMALQFNDSGTYIYSNTDGDLTVRADGNILTNINGTGVLMINSGGVRVTNTLELSTGNIDDNYFTIGARDNGVGLIEVAIVQGAAEPYMEISRAGDLIPSEDSTYDLGTNTVRWANLYVDTIIATSAPAPGAHASEHEVAGSDLVSHDSLTDFVGNEHINHTSVTITAGTGLAYSSGGTDISASATLIVDLSELTDMTTAVVGAEDELILLDSGADRRKLVSEINLSQFNDDLTYTPAAHVLATTGPHSGTLPLADLAVGTQGGIIRRGAADWEEYALGTSTYVLKVGATDAAWGQVDYSELVGTQPAPVAHVLATTGPHTGTLPLADLAAGSQGSIIYRNATDWAELAKGTTTYILKSGATTISWSTVDWSELSGTQPAPVSHTLQSHTGDLAYSQIDAIVDVTGGGTASLLNVATHVHTAADGSSKVTYTDLLSIPSTFTPASHDIITGHTDSGLTIGYVIIATGTTTFAWGQMAYADISGTPSSLPPDAHVLATTGPHTSTLPVSDMSFDADVIPTASTWDLGSATYQWVNLYLNDAGTVYFGAAQDTVLFREAAADLVLDNPVTGADAFSTFRIRGNYWENPANVEQEYSLGFETYSGTPRLVIKVDDGGGLADVVWMEQNDITWFMGTYERVYMTSTGGLQLDNLTTGSGISSPVFRMSGNYYDGSNHEIEGAIFLQTGSDPYISIQVDDDGATPVLTSAFRFYNDMFTPHTANANALGSTSLEFSDLYLGDGSIIYLGNDQDVTLTHVADTGLLLNSTRQLQFNDSNEYIYSDGTYLYLAGGGGWRMRMSTFVDFGNTNVTNLGDGGTDFTSTAATIGVPFTVNDNMTIGDTYTLWIGATNPVGLVRQADNAMLIDLAGSSATDFDILIGEITAGHWIKYAGTGSGDTNYLEFHSGNYGTSDNKHLAIHVTSHVIDVYSTLTMTSGIGINMNGEAITGAGAGHDQFSDFVGNEHIDHTTITITAGTGLAYSIGGTDISADATMIVDLSELTDMTVAVVGAEDELILLDSGADRRKLISEIALSAFNNDLGTGGTVTSVGAGAGMDFTTITATGTVIMGTPSNVTQASTSAASGTTHSHAWSHTSSGDWDSAFSASHTQSHVLSGADHTASGLTIGYVIRASGTTTFAWAQLAYTDISGTPSSLPPDAHVLATTGPHSGTLPLADLAVGTQGGIIRRGVTDWEEYALGTSTYVLKAGATDVAWGQVDYSELVGTQPAPVSHALNGGSHSGDLDYTQLDAIVDTSGGGTASYINAATHVHTAADGSSKVTYTDLLSIPSTFTPEAHVLATTGPHSGTLPLADLAVGTQGGIIRRGATDWEEYALGTSTYVLKAGATDVAWGQVAYTEVTGTPSEMTPSAHVLATTGPHTGTLPVADISFDASIIPTTTGFDLGSATYEYTNLYLGTGKAYFYTDQGESIDSDGTNLRFGVGASDRVSISTTSMYPNTDSAINLGGTSNYFADAYIDEVITEKITVEDTSKVDQIEMVWDEEAEALVFNFVG